MNIKPLAVLLLFTATGSRSFGQEKTDSTQLATLVSHAYQWHNRQITEDKGFDPRKERTADTLYSGIDFKAVNYMINKYSASGFFNNDFLANYKALATRMDQELHTRISRWREGDLPPFNHNADPWCNCDAPAGTYWQKIKLSDVKINGDSADLHWTWGNGFSYHIKAKKDKGRWKISYLEGYDAAQYHWAAGRR